MTSESAQDALDALDAVLSHEQRVDELISWVRLSDGYDALMGTNEFGEGECTRCAFVHDGKGDYVADTPTEFCNHIARHAREGHLLPPQLQKTVRATWKGKS